MRARAAVVTAVLVALSGAACGGGDDGTAPTTVDEATPGPVPLVVDTDGGSDDAMALLYLLQHPGVEIEAITVSGTGLVHCDPGVANVEGLVTLAAPGVEIPIACGASTPLAGARAFPDDWRTQAGGRYGGILPAGTAPAESGDAVDLLATAIGGSERPITLLTLGPLTNVAAALAESPDLVDGIDRVVVMGGAFDAPGNVALDGEPEAATTEWNIYVDPTAAEAVLDSGVDVTFVPLDSQVPVDPYVVRALADGATSPAGRTIADLLQSSPFFVSDGFFLWDPLAAAAVATPDLFVLRERQATVRTEGPTAGRTVAGEGRPVSMAVVVETEEFLASFLGTLAGRPGPIEVSRVPDTRVTVAPDACRLTETAIAGGPAVLGFGTTGAAAVGTLEAGRTDAEIDAYLTSNPTAPPEWFPLVALLQPDDGNPSATFVDLAPGELTVVCVAADGAATGMTGRATLTVTPAP